MLKDGRGIERRFALQLFCELVTKWSVRPRVYPRGHVRLFAVFNSGSIDIAFDRLLSWNSTAPTPTPTPTRTSSRGSSPTRPTRAI